MPNLKAIVTLFAVSAAGRATAQVDLFPKPWANPRLWSAETLWVGASFTRSSLDPVTVTLKGNEAGWTGDLYFIDPKTGAEDRLFSNHDPVGTTVELSARHDIPVGDTLYFEYRVTQPQSGNYPSAASRLPKYTGANIPGQSRYVTTPTNPKFGHRWSVAGRVNDSLVEFGFEDNVEPSNSDYDFDDIVFRTTLSLLNDEAPARLSFTDKSGNKLADGAFYSPANDTLYLTYTDDYAGGNVRKDVVVKIKNRRGGAAPDSESVSALPLTREGNTGIWKAKLPIEEAGGIPGDGKAQVYWLGEVTAAVKSHNRSGLPDGGTVTAALNVAYPDQPETVKVRACPDTAAAINRATACINVKVTDQSFTRHPDTVWAEVRCDLTGDVLARVPLFETADGTYRSGDIPKNEGAADPADQALSCKTSDDIRVTYTDEVYGNKVSDKAAWTLDAPEDLYFANPGDIATRITTAKDGQNGNVLQIVAEGPSPNVAAKDTLLVTVTTDGDTETVSAEETGANTNVYTVPLPFLFQTRPPEPGNGRLEAYLDPAKAVASVTATAKAIIDGKPFTAQVVLLPSLNAAQAAYIKDSDGDTRGDKVYVVFTRPLLAPPATVTPLYWNQLLDDPQHAFKGAPRSISLDPARPNVVVIDLGNAPFPKGLTGVPPGAQPPIVTLPSDNVFGGQKPILDDSLGPILTRAEIHPFNGQAIGKNTGSLDVDTLFVTVSEKIAAHSDWMDLLRVGAAADGQCSDYGHALRILPAAAPAPGPDGLVYTVLVGGDAGGPRPFVGDCVYLDTSGGYVDLPGNRPPVHGEILTGNPPPRRIEFLQGYPPVAGMSPDFPGFAVSNGDTHERGAFNTQQGANWVVEWIPPADWPAGYVPGVSVYLPEAHSPADPAKGPDPAKHGSMPPGIGTVQVVSTGEYVADVSIFDNLGNWVKSFSQSFGYRGELANGERRAKNGKGLVSFLVWDLKDAHGRRVGNGAYVWKIGFRFKTGKQEIRYVRTGVARGRAR